MPYLPRIAHAALACTSSCQRPREPSLQCRSQGCGSFGTKYTIPTNDDDVGADPAAQFPTLCTAARNREAPLWTCSGPGVRGVSEPVTEIAFVLVDWKLGDGKFVDRKVFIIEDSIRRDQCRFRFGTFETSQGVLMLLALVALDEMDFTGLEREVLLLLPLEVP